MEKKIKSYKEFLDDSKLNEEEGLKDWAVGTAMAASTLNPFSKTLASDSPVVDKSKSSIEKSTQSTEKEDDGKTFHWGKENDKDTLTMNTRSKNVMLQKTKYEHWTLDSTTVDTKWDTIVKSAGGTRILVLDAKLSDDQYFKSGSFTLDQSIKSKIDSLLNEVKANKYQITDIGIESSTDGQAVGPTVKKNLESNGYKGDNSGLAEARAETISNYLDVSGVDDSLISINSLPEQNLGGADKNGREQAARYVTVRIAVLSFKKEDLPVITEIVPSIKKTYYLSKVVDDSGSTYNPSRGKGIRKKDMGYIRNTTREKVKECVLPGAKVKYNKRTGLYSNY
jgi:outer membrane protein OmpA-like peptidoglycan-associated protein